MPGNTLILDCEVYRNFFYLGVKRVEDQKRVGFEFSPRADFDRDKVRLLLRRNQSIGFNSLNYDMAIIYMALDGATNDELKEASDYIINSRLQPWQSQQNLGIVIPRNVDHIDLFETNPAVKKGLKALNGSMHHKRLQELPYHHTTILSPKQMDEVIEYCQYGDIDGTETLFRRMGEPIKLRELLREQYNTVDLRSKSDAQVGETIIKTEVERNLGTRVKRAIIPDGTTFRYEPPEWMRFETPMMQRVFETVINTDIVVGKNGKVDLPKEFGRFDINFGGVSYTLGIGGLHSTESNRAVHSDNQFVLIDADVASQYPSIIMKLGLFPKALGKHFLPVYKSIIDARLKAKREKDKATDKGLKIAINGSYGKLGSGFSTLFAPHLMVAVTLTGQLSLLMLIERAHLAGIEVVSGNTDGVIFRCPREKWDGFIIREDGSATDRLRPSPIQDVIDWWEKLTSFTLEFAEYRSVYSQSVNSYIAIKPDGSFKRKGKLANHWREELPWGGANTDFDPYREGLKKAPAMTICADAALGLLLHGIPVEETIWGCDDVREFITIVAATGGATWGPGEPIIEERDRPDGKGKVKGLFGYEGEEYLGKLVRFYWSTDGNPIIRQDGHKATGTRGIVPKTDGCRPLMTLPDDFAVPVDLDRQRYIDEAYSILRDIGYEAQTVYERILARCLQIN